MFSLLGSRFLILKHRTEEFYKEELIMNGRNISITGDLGSGKTTIAKRLAERLGYVRYSVGEAQRRRASDEGITTLELNRRAENDPEIDKQIDADVAAFAHGKSHLVIDGRLGWYIVPETLKLKLVVHPFAAASRIFQGDRRKAEPAESLEKILENLTKRAVSENLHFKKTYGVDITQDENFDYVIDTTAASPDEIVACILKIIEVPSVQTKYWICAKNLFPSQSIRDFLPRQGSRETGDNEARLRGAFSPIKFARDGARNYVIFDGHHRVRATMKAGISHIPAELVEDEQRRMIALSSLRSMSMIYDWEAALGFRFVHYPKLPLRPQSELDVIKIPPSTFNL
jgi:cytidylate kinase